MPFVYVYTPADFVSGLPAESGARAAGSPPFTLTLRPDAVPTVVEIADNDAIFDEVDATQSLTQEATLEGTIYPAGTTINTAYDLINTGSGHKVTSFHLGGDGFQQGAVDGIVSTVEMQPGQSYTFNTERTSHQQNNPYTDYVACFTPGTMIETEDGPRAIETLAPGDRIATLDNGFQPLRALPRSDVDAARMAEQPRLRPVRVRADSLGPGVPARDMLVSPQHRFLANSPIVARVIGADEVLVAALSLTKLPGIERAEDVEAVTYMHLVLDAHEVVIADGCATESFYAGPNAIRAMTEDAREELRALFPELMAQAEAGEAQMPPRARPFALGRTRQMLVREHKRHDTQLVTQTPRPS